MKNDKNVFLSLPEQRRAILSCSVLNIDSLDFADMPKSVAVCPGELATIGVYLDRNGKMDVGEKIKRVALGAVGVKSKINADFNTTIVGLLGAIKSSLWSQQGRNVCIDPELEDVIASRNIKWTFSHDHGCLFGAINLTARLGYGSLEVDKSKNADISIVPAGTEFLSAILANPYWAPTLNGSPVPFAYVLGGCETTAKVTEDKVKYLCLRYGYGNLRVGLAAEDEKFDSFVAYPTWRLL